LWTNFYNGPGNSSDDASAVAVDASGNVYVTGGSRGTDNRTDFATVAYSIAGVAWWTNRYGGPGNDDLPQAVAVDANGDVYVTGFSRGSATGNDFATIKYVTPPFLLCHPLSCTNAVGTTASFTVQVAGSAPFSYQWRKGETDLTDGGNLSGVTTPNLQIAAVQLSDACGYSVVVTNAWGSATSHVAQLTVVSVGRFSNLSYSPVTGLSFVFCDATVGQPYRIQRSSSLQPDSWTNWQSFTYSEPLFLTDMGAAGHERRFYRAVSP